MDHDEYAHLSIDHANLILTSARTTKSRQAQRGGVATAAAEEPSILGNQNSKVILNTHNHFIATLGIKKTIPSNYAISINGSTSSTRKKAIILTRNRQRSSSTTQPLSQSLHFQQQQQQQQQQQPQQIILNNQIPPQSTRNNNDYQEENSYINKGTPKSNLPRERTFFSQTTAASAVTQSLIKDKTITESARQLLIESTSSTIDLSNQQNHAQAPQQQQQPSIHNMNSLNHHQSNQNHLYNSQHFRKMSNTTQSQQQDKPSIKLPLSSTTTITATSINHISTEDTNRSCQSSRQFIEFGESSLLIDISKIPQPENLYAHSIMASPVPNSTKHILFGDEIINSIYETPVRRHAGASCFKQENSSSSSFLLGSQENDSASKPAQMQLPFIPMSPFLNSNKCNKRNERTPSSQSQSQQGSAQLSSSRTPHNGSSLNNYYDANFLTANTISNNSQMNPHPFDTDLDTSQQSISTITNASILLKTPLSNSRQQQQQQQRATPVKQKQLIIENLRNRLAITAENDLVIGYRGSVDLENSLEVNGNQLSSSQQAAAVQPQQPRRLSNLSTVETISNTNGQNECFPEYVPLHSQFHQLKESTQFNNLTARRENRNYMQGDKQQKQKGSISLSSSSKQKKNQSDENESTQNAAGVTATAGIITMTPARGKCAFHKLNKQKKKMGKINHFIFNNLVENVVDIDSPSILNSARSPFVIESCSVKQARSNQLQSKSRNYDDELKAENDSPDFNHIRKYYNNKYGNKLQQINNETDQKPLDRSENEQQSNRFRINCYSTPQKPKFKKYTNESKLQSQQQYFDENDDPSKQILPWEDETTS